VSYLRSLLHAYGNLGLAAQGAIVVALVLVTTGIGVGMVIWIPPDHFTAQRQEPSRSGHPLWRWTVLVLKNALGVVLLVLGAIMALPLVPGPGLVFILLGLSVLDFPGKRKAERRLLAIPGVTGFINQVRARFRRPPLLLGPSSAQGDAR
jgi:archaellum biogenesis protein FlaJ (TadC family)